MAEDDNAPPRDGADNKPKSSSGRTAGRDPGGRASRSGRIRLGWDRESRSGLGSGRGAGTGRRTRGGVRGTENHNRDAEGSRGATGDGRGKSRSGRSFRGASGGASEVDARDVTASQSNVDRDRSKSRRTDQRGAASTPQIPGYSNDVSVLPELKIELRGLSAERADLVARYLAAAELADDLEQGYGFALAAKRLAARVGAVREACGIAAYRTGRWAEALSELRVARRMTGRNDYLPIMADCERALGRLDRALALIREANTAGLSRAMQIELRIVESGIRQDQGLPEAAVLVLQVPELTSRRTRPWSARLFYAYGDALLAADRDEEARDAFARAAGADLNGETDAAERLDELDGITFDDLEDDEYLADDLEDDELEDEASPQADLDVTIEDLERAITKAGLREISEPNALSQLPVTIYLSEENGHQRVEAAIENLLALAGLEVTEKNDPIIGSWFRRMSASASKATQSPAVREAALVAAHAADTRLVLAQDAAVTATLLQNLGPVIASLQPTKDAVIRMGAVLLVKIDWVITIHQLTAAQQALLDHQPRLVTTPHEIIEILSKSCSDGKIEDFALPKTRQDS